MSEGVYTWSQTKATNATADSGVNWAEGQAPSSVNDSARAMMASVAKWRDDISKATVTGGTGAAYTLTSNQAFASLALMDRSMVSFIPLTTNTTTSTTLNVDGLGAKALRYSSGLELPIGALIGGTPYVATYFNSNSEWYVHGYYGDPYQIPLGGMIDYTGTTAPNSSFVIPIGQAISRTTYATLFALIGTTFGVGDGSTTFNVPDLTGRVVAMKESVATRLTSTYFGGVSTTLGAVGGLESHTLVAANLPPYTPAGTNSTSNSTATFWTGGTVGTSAGVATSTPSNASLGTVTVAAQTFTGTAAPGQISTPARTVQPTIILNKIMRVI